MSVAVLQGLRHRSAGLTFKYVTTHTGHRVSEVINDRLKTLVQNDDLNAALLAEECQGILSILSERGPLSLLKAPILPQKSLALVKAAPVVKAPVAPKEPFCAEFLEFIASGDISALAPTGQMSAAMFAKTQDYIFCHIEKINGRTAHCYFHSKRDKYCGAVLVPGVEAQLGPAIILREKGAINGIIQPVPAFEDRARSFNMTAARSKK